MEKITKKLNILSFTAIFIVVFTILFSAPSIKLNAYDGGFYDYGYDSGYGYDYGYDSGYGYDYGYESGYDSYYDSGYGTSYYSGYDSTCYNCGGSYYDNTCYDCYTPPVCTTCTPTPPIVPNVIVSCSPSNYNIDSNQSVTWNAYASGGNGSLSYSWSGTDGLSGSGSQTSKTYSSTGSKTAHVTVTSGGKTSSADCGTVFVEEQTQLISGSCSVDDSNINVDESVRWRADASGGNGSYSYEWFGDYPLSGRNGRDVNVSYNSVGTKYGSVTIRSGGQSITRSCGTVYVNDDYNPYYPPNNYNLNLSCTVNSSNVSSGQTATWNAYATGGNGNYYYSWTGADGLYGNSSSISKAFSTLGTKYATVTVTSNGQTKSLNCPTVVVGSTGGLGYMTANQGNLAGLTSVYLNQVPYTGVGDNPKFIAFIIGLFMFSALAAYMIVSKRAKIERKNKILDFKNQNMLNRIKN
jgi:hypothetical protein